MKLNVETREIKEWTKEGFAISEPIFVERPGSSGEDEGCVIFYALDFKDPMRVLLDILDAVSFREEALVDFTARGVVPIFIAYLIGIEKMWTVSNFKQV